MRRLQAAKLSNLISQTAIIVSLPNLATTNSELFGEPERSRESSWVAPWEKIEDAGREQGRGGFEQKLIQERNGTEGGNQSHATERKEKTFEQRK